MFVMLFDLKVPALAFNKSHLLLVFLLPSRVICAHPAAKAGCKLNRLNKNVFFMFVQFSSNFTIYAFIIKCVL